MPRKIIGGAFTSLDGVVQAPGGPDEDTSGGFPYGGWLAPLDDEGLDNQIATLFNREFDLLLGRRTYDIFAAHWPFMPKDEPIAAAFAKARKYVLTRSDAPLEWEGSHRLANLEALEALKRQDGPDLVIQGSSTIYPQLLERGLIDRLTVMTAPLILGTGKRLFGDGTPARTLKLIEQRVTARGHVMTTYEPAGSVERGAFATPEPNARETARRAKIAAGTW